MKKLVALLLCLVLALTCVSALAEGSKRWEDIPHGETDDDNVGLKKADDNDRTSEIKKKNRADRIDRLQFSTVYDNITFKYLLAPIWLASYKYKDQVYNIVINGQTGKIGGKAPVSALKVFLFILAIVAAIIILYFLFGRS